MCPQGMPCEATLYGQCLCAWELTLWSQGPDCDRLTPAGRRWSRQCRKARFEGAYLNGGWVEMAQMSKHGMARMPRYGFGASPGATAL